MFKRFLKFFRGDEGGPQEAFEGSYLDHLLQQVRPSVEANLADEPRHDPLLLVIVGILRHTMINAWSPRLRSPLVDSQSPGFKPGLDDVPDAIDGTASDSDTTDEFAPPDETAESEPADAKDDADIERGRASDEEDDEEDGSDEPELEAASEEGEGDDVEDAPEPTAEHDIPQLDVDASTKKPFRKTEEIDVEEIRAASRRASLASADRTMERDAIELEPGDPTVEIDQDVLLEAQPQDDRPRVDTEDVLQAGRMFLGLLIENDRLPVELQLSVAETTLARDLLLGYFVGHDNFEEKARRLLTMVEQKFGEGAFSQARILLELFHTDEQTRINNDRNLFYEDMILRLGIRRRHRMSAEELRRFDTLRAEANDPEGATRLCEWLAETCLIRFQTFNRDPAQVASWKEVVGKSKRSGARETFLRYIPPRRWRPVGSYPDLTIVDQLNRHISTDTGRDYVIDLLESCYFVLRAVGDTGLEGFLDTFFDWAKETYDIDATVIMPVLYKRSMMDPEPMQLILEELYDEYFAARTATILDEWTEDDVERALYEAVANFEHADLSEIAPGYYDLGAFVYDELFGVRYPYPEFPFKIHRLT